EVLDVQATKALARSAEVAHRPIRFALELELAELRAHDTVGRQVIEGLDDHLRRVEVAFGEYEGAGARGVHRRIAVGRDEPDEVIVLRMAPQERAPLGVDQGDSTVLGEAS